MRKIIRTIILVTLSIALLVFVFSRADRSLVVDALLSASPNLLVFGLLLMFLSYPFRAQRWRYLLRPVEPVGFNSSFRATTIGFAINALLPGRVGELVRPLVLARREKLSATSAFATVVIERLLDLLVVCVVLLCFAVSGFQNSSGGDELLAAMRSTLLILSLLAVGGLGFVFYAAFQPDWSARLNKRLHVAESGGIKYRTIVAFQRFLEGLAIIRDRGSFFLALVWSIPLWLTMAVSVWCVSTAFGVIVTVNEAALLLAMIFVGVSLPTPAGVGGYHAAYQLGATTLFGASADKAVGAGLVLHLFSFGPVIFLGLFFMVQEGLWFGNIKEMVAKIDKS
tara:strand:+ start:2803 stop:3819 length:1017 start_codon:yes stop_codon:yes gene_type:complete